MDYTVLKELLNTSFQKGIAYGILTYLEYDAPLSYKRYKGKKSNEKIFSVGTQVLVNKILELIPADEKSKTNPPPRKDGEVSLKAWKDELLPILQEKTEEFTQFLRQKNILKENSPLTRSLIKDQSKLITAACLQLS